VLSGDGVAAIGVRVDPEAFGADLDASGLFDSKSARTTLF